MKKKEKIDFYKKNLKDSELAEIISEFSTNLFNSFSEESQWKKIDRIYIYSFIFKSDKLTEEEKAGYNKFLNNLFLIIDNIDLVKVKSLIKPTSKYEYKEVDKTKNIFL